MKNKISYLVGPYFDSLWLLLPPLWGIFIYSLFQFPSVLTLLPAGLTWETFFIQVLISAHLFVVLIRAIGNPRMRQTHRGKMLTLTVLFTTLCFYEKTLPYMVVLVLWWDVYHSSLQTYGLGRMYEAHYQVETTSESRRFDYGFTLLTYAAPIFWGVGGETLIFPLIDLGLIHKTLGPEVLHYFKPLCFGFQITWMLIYLLKKPKRFIWQKMVLYYLTAVICAYVWWTGPVLKALFIINFFHAIQYIALIWWSEKKHFRLKGPIFLLGVLALGIGYGVTEVLGQIHSYSTGNLWFKVNTVVALVHFSFDGFLWRIRSTSKPLAPS